MGVTSQPWNPLPCFPSAVATAQTLLQEHMFQNGHVPGRADGYAGRLVRMPGRVSAFQHSEALTDREGMWRPCWSRLCRELGDREPCVSRNPPEPVCQAGEAGFAFMSRLEGLQMFSFQIPALRSQVFLVPFSRLFVPFIPDGAPTRGGGGDHAVCIHGFESSPDTRCGLDLLLCKLLTSVPMLSAKPQEEPW